MVRPGLIISIIYISLISYDKIPPWLFIFMFMLRSMGKELPSRSAGSVLFWPEFCLVPDVVVQVVDLLVAMCRAALESPRKSIIFEPYPSVVDPNDPKTLAFNPKVIYPGLFIRPFRNLTLSSLFFFYILILCRILLLCMDDFSMHYSINGPFLFSMSCPWTMGHRRKIMRDCRRL